SPPPQRSGGQEPGRRGHGSRIPRRIRRVDGRHGRGLDRVRPHHPVHDDPAALCPRPRPAAQSRGQPGTESAETARCPAEREHHVRMTGYPNVLVPPGGTAPVPRRLRGRLGTAWVFDTERALYVWEFPPYPQYYVPLADVDTDLLVDEHRSETTEQGTAALCGVRAGELARPGAVRVYGAEAAEPLRHTARFVWAAL